MTHPSFEVMSSCCPAPEEEFEPELVERLKSSPGALILHRRFDLRAQLLSSAARPIRIAQEFPRQKNEIGFSSRENSVSRRSIGDHPDGSRQNVGLLTNRLGERNLITRADRDLLKRHEPRTRSVDQ